MGWRKTIQGLKVDPASYELNVNMGNVYLAQNDTTNAEKYYKAAVDIYPQNGTVHYNLSKLYLKLVTLDDASTEFQLAMKLSPDIVEYYSEIMDTSSPNFNRLVIDEQVSKKSYSERYKEYVAGSKNIASKILPVEVKGIEFDKITYVSLILLLVLAFLHIINKSYAFTTVCQKCGGAVCYKCQRSIKDNKLCSQCYYIIIRREGVDPKSKIVKMLQIKNYIARRLFMARVMSFILPGTGHILKGMTIRGILFLSLFLIFGVYIIIPNGFINDLYVTGVTEDFFTFGSHVLLLALAAVYIIAIRDIYHSE